MNTCSCFVRQRDDSPLTPDPALLKILFSHEKWSADANLKEKIIT